MITQDELELELDRVWQGIAPDALEAFDDVDSPDVYSLAECLADCFEANVTDEAVLALWRSIWGQEAIDLCKKVVERYV